MKKLTPFLQPSIFFLLTLTGIFIGKFTGGLITGAAAMLFIFVTTGKVLARKANERTNRQLRTKSRWEEKLREMQKRRDMQ